MSMLDGLQLTQAEPLSPEEELAEAQAHGFDTVEAFYAYIEEAYELYENDQK